MSEKKFRSTRIIVLCLEEGKRATDKTPAVAPVTEEKKVGTLFVPSDFSKEEFTRLYNAGTLVEHVSGATDEASAHYDASTPATGRTGEVLETEAKRKERLLNEAKTLGVEGVTKAMKADTIQAKIDEHKNARNDGSTPSTQEGAGRQNPSEGENGGAGAGGNAQGSAGGAGTDDEDLVG